MEMMIILNVTCSKRKQ